MLSEEAFGFFYLFEMYYLYCSLYYVTPALCKLERGLKGEIDNALLRESGDPVSGLLARDGEQLNQDKVIQMKSSVEKHVKLCK